MFSRALGRGHTLSQSHLCGLSARQSGLGHQPQLFLTLEIRQSGRVVFFFPWHIPSLPLASFKGGSSECFLVCAEGDTYSTCPPWAFRSAMAGSPGLHGPWGPVQPAVIAGPSLLNEEEGQRPLLGLIGRAWRPGNSLASQ